MPDLTGSGFVEEEDKSLALQRRNIYDNDEFDVFRADNVDMSKIHQGKM